jgi:hypothetical protein
VTDNGLQGLALCCPAIKWISLTVADNLTPETLGSVVQHWLKLKHLRLWIRLTTVWGDALEDALLEMLRFSTY